MWRSGRDGMTLEDCIGVAFFCSAIVSNLFVIGACGRYLGLW